MATKTSKKEQTTIYKTLHIKLKIKYHEPHKNLGFNSSPIFQYYSIFSFLCSVLYNCLSITFLFQPLYCMFFLKLWLLISPFASLNFSFTLELIKQENIGSGAELKKMKNKTYLTVRTVPKSYCKIAEKRKILYT